MAEATRGSGLRTIFSFFLGLMLTAFVGVGVYTFHPPPDQFDGQLRDLGRREQAIREARAPNELTSADRDSLQTIERRRNELIDAAAAARKPWGRSTSIILIVFATAAMVVSLIRADQLPVISNGLLLGGLLTMLYGVGWIIATDTSIGRFVVMTIALLITLGLGYVRFVRRGPTTTTSGMVPTDAQDVADLARRVHELEERMQEAATALGPKRT
jgi:hypothetical protein